MERVHLQCNAQSQMKVLEFFPYYVLHQTVIIIVGVWLGRFSAGFYTEFFTLILLAAIITALFHHFVVLRSGRAARLFGG